MISQKIIALAGTGMLLAGLQGCVGLKPGGNVDNNIEFPVFTFPKTNLIVGLTLVDRGVGCGLVVGVKNAGIKHMSSASLYFDFIDAEDGYVFDTQSATVLGLRSGETKTQDAGYLRAADGKGYGCKELSATLKGKQKMEVSISTSAVYQ